MDSFKWNHFQFQVNELLSVGRLSLDEVAPVQDVTKEVFVPHVNEVNQRFNQIENKRNELHNIGNFAMQYTSKTKKVENPHHLRKCVF